MNEVSAPDSSAGAIRTLPTSSPSRDLAGSAASMCAGKSIEGGPLPRLLIVICAVDRGDITLDRALQDLFPARGNDAIEIVPVDGIEWERLQRNRNSGHLLRRERNQIRVAAHEAQEFAVGGHGRDVRRAQHPAAAGA